jgi:hypothetical protein
MKQTALWQNTEVAQICKLVPIYDLRCILLHTFCLCVTTVYTMIRHI